MTHYQQARFTDWNPCSIFTLVQQTSQDQARPGEFADLQVPRAHHWGDARQPGCNSGRWHWLRKVHSGWCLGLKRRGYSDLLHGRGAMLKEMIRKFQRAVKTVLQPGSSSVYDFTQLHVNKCANVSNGWSIYPRWFIYITSTSTILISK